VATSGSSSGVSGKMPSQRTTFSKRKGFPSAIGDTESLRKYGRIGNKIDDVDALMLYSLQRGMITEEQYREFVAIKEEYPDEEDEDSEDQESILSNAWL
jgi:hypothetical protein